MPQYSDSHVSRGTEGAAIEIGAGTGFNLEHDPEAVTRLVLAEPDRHMRRRLGQRVDTLDRAAESRAGPGTPAYDCRDAGDGR